MHGRLDVVILSKSKRIDGYVIGIKRLAAHYRFPIKLVKRRITKRPILLLMYQGQVSVIDACPSSVFWGEDFCDSAQIAHYFKLNLTTENRRSYCMHPLLLPLVAPTFSTGFAEINTWANLSSYALASVSRWREVQNKDHAMVWVLDGGQSVFDGLQLSHGLMKGKAILCLSEPIPSSVNLTLDLHYSWEKSPKALPNRLQKWASRPDVLHQMARVNREYALEYLLPEQQAKQILSLLFQASQNDVFHRQSEPIRFSAFKSFFGRD